MSFKDRFKQLSGATRGANLAVLVWGPGDAGKGHDKRKQIRERLSDHFHEADIQFSEDLGEDLEESWPGATGDSGVLKISEQEFLHLAACDLCVVLDASKGAGEEIAHFVNSRYASRLLILTNEKYKDADSFPGELRKFGNQQFYNDDEMKSCRLIEKVMTVAKRIAVAKLGDLL